MRLLCPMFMALAGAWFGFANPWLHFPAAIILLPMALTLVARQAVSQGNAFRLGLVTTLPGYSAALYWLAIPVHDYGAMPWALALPCPVLVGLILAAYAGLYCAGLHWAGRAMNGLAGALTAGLLWTTLELARNELFTGFPWLTMSTALVPWHQTLGLARWIGAFGLSGLLAAMAHLLAQETWPKRLATLPLCGLLLLPGLLYHPSVPTNTANVAMIQGNIDQARKWDANVQAEIVGTYTELSSKALAQGPTDLVIWPETSLPFFFQDPSDLVTAVTGSVHENGVPLLAGSPAYTLLREPVVPPYVLRNRAYLLDKNGEVDGWYDKEHLVPFGEYVPLGQWLPLSRNSCPAMRNFVPARTNRRWSVAPCTWACWSAMRPFSLNWPRTTWNGEPTY